MNTCLELKRAYDAAWTERYDKYNVEMAAQARREFPVGSAVTFRYGAGRIKGTVTGHGTFDFLSDVVLVRNDRSKIVSEKRAWELEHCPESAQPALKLKPGKQRSKCCKGTISVETDGEGTSFHSCNSCGKPCDLA